MTHQSLKTMDPKLDPRWRSNLGQKFVIFRDLVKELTFYKVQPFKVPKKLSLVLGIGSTPTLDPLGVQKIRPSNLVLQY